MSNEIANLLAKKFIARSDVKARQYPGGYTPVENDGHRFPWTRQDLLDHLDGKQTYGHYLLSQDSQCKLFVFDVDLEKVGSWDEVYEDDVVISRECNPREAWLDRGHPARPQLKQELRTIAHRLGKAVETELEIPWAAAYSGGKGIHVYGFTGLLPASDVRDGALMVIESIKTIQPLRGANFFTDTDFPNMSIEVFPKQSSLEGKDLGNLCRLPLGRNLKNPKDPTFFLDMTSSMNELRPLDPVYALTTDSQWKKPGE